MRTGHAPRRWLWMLITAAVLCQIGSNLARPLISYKVLALGGDSAMVGLTSASYALVPVAATLWLGRLSDKRSSLSGIAAVGTVLLALGPIGLSFSPSLLLVTVASALLGVGQLCFTIAGQSAIARFVPPARADAAFGWFTASFAVGQMLGPLLAGLSMGSSEGVSIGARLADANAALLAAGIASFVAIPFALGTSVRPAQRVRLAMPSSARPDSVIGLLRFPAVRTNILASLALLATTDILVAFLPLLGEDRGVPPVIVGVLLAVRAGSSIASRLLLQPLLARWSRPALVTWSLVGAGVTVAMLPWFFQHVLVAGTLLVIGGFFLGLGQPLTMTLVTRAVPEASRGTALAIRLLGNRLGQVTLPVAAGLLAAPAGASGALWMTSAVLAAACLPRWRDSRHPE